MPVQVKCKQCGSDFSVIPARKDSAKFCSYECRGKWRSENWKGENTSNWKSDAVRSKPCEHCGTVFHIGNRRPSVFAKLKFCSHECQVAGQYRRSGSDHPSWRADSRKQNRAGQHGSWARKVLSRDKATCQHCGAKDRELHAHHIKS